MPDYPKDPRPNSGGGSADFTMKRAMDGQIINGPNTAEGLRADHSAAWCPKCGDYPCSCGGSGSMDDVGYGDK